MRWPWQRPAPKVYPPGWCMVMGWTEAQPCDATCCANRIRAARETGGEQ